MFSLHAIQRMIDEKINHPRPTKATKKDSPAVRRVTAVATTALAAIALSGGAVAPASAATPGTASAGTANQSTSASVGASPFLGGVSIPGRPPATSPSLLAQGGVGLGPGWANQPSGSFGTEDPADHISYVVQKDAVGAEAVEFRLVIGHTSSGRAKAIIMPDGEPGGGSQWVIEAQGRGASATNGLWAHQVKNGQVLTFRKPGFLNIWSDAIQIGYLEDLDPGDRVVFTWNKD
jgi:hypothetical protein